MKKKRGENCRQKKSTQKSKEAGNRKACSGKLNEVSEVRMCDAAITNLVSEAKHKSVASELCRSESGWAFLQSDHVHCGRYRQKSGCSCR